MDVPPFINIGGHVPPVPQGSTPLVVLAYVGLLLSKCISLLQCDTCADQCDCHCQCRISQASACTTQIQTTAAGMATRSLHRPGGPSSHQPVIPRNLGKETAILSGSGVTWGSAQIPGAYGDDEEITTGNRAQKLGSSFSQLQTEAKCECSNSKHH